MSDFTQLWPLPHSLRFVALASVLIAVVYGWLLTQKKHAAGHEHAQTISESIAASDRDLVALLRESEKRFAFLYSSQTGTALRFCTALAREIKTRCQVPSMLGDVESYDYGTLDQMPEDSAIVFVISTYGEGEPTDSGRGLHDFLLDQDVLFSQGGSELRNLRYAIFGCGNSSYEHFNRAAIDIDNRLAELGATRIGKVGLGDDDVSLEEDFLAWKESICEEIEGTYQPQGYGNNAPSSDFRVSEMSLDQAAPRVFHGELSTSGNNPYPAPVLLSRDLFQAGGERTCIHTEIDIAGTGLSYQAGDHLGIWPSNPDVEVERMLAILGLSGETVVQVESLDPTLSQIPFPTPTTYLAAFRHYLDISSVPSRSLIMTLAQYTPNDTARSRMVSLGSDRNYFHQEVVKPCLRLPEVLLAVAGDDLSGTTVTRWSIPFTLLITMLPRLQPRYYSISSSSKLYPDTVHLTTVVVRDPVGSSAFDNRSRWMYGLGTNFILNIKHAIAKAESIVPSPPDITVFPTPTYDLLGPKGSHFTDGAYRIPVHVRPSTFRLPKSPRIPVIMIGPGTGVAPFRAFVQDRVALAKSEEVVKDLPLSQWAPMHLFYGCRRSDEDFLYRNEWPTYEDELAGRFKLHCAFSREAPLKADGDRVYVQDLLWKKKDELAELILHHNAFVYICGDAKNMCRAVEDTLKKMLGAARGGTAEDAGAKELKSLKDRRRFMTDVWT